MNTALATTILTTSAALLAALTAPAQAETPKPAADSFVLEVGTHELAGVIDQAATFLGYNILTSPTDGTSQPGTAIRITERVEEDAAGAWELLGSLLYHKGFAIVALDPEKGFYEVIAMNGPRRGEISTGARYVPADRVGEFAKQKAMPIFTTVPVEHIDATVASNALRPFFAVGGPSAGLTVGNVGHGRSVLLQGFGPQVVAAAELLRRVDVPEEEDSLSIRVVRLEHAVAEEVEGRLEEVFRSPQMAPAMQGRGMVGPPPLKIGTQSSLNALVLSGTATQIELALDLIARLDAPAVDVKPALRDVEARLNALEQRIETLEKRLGVAR